jgi:hypothetical protein
MNSSIQNLIKDAEQARLKTDKIAKDMSQSLTSARLQLPQLPDVEFKKAIIALINGQCFRFVSFSMVVDIFSTRFIHKSTGKTNNLAILMFLESIISKIDPSEELIFYMLYMHFFKFEHPMYPLSAMSENVRKRYLTLHHKIFMNSEKLYNNYYRCFNLKKDPLEHAIDTTILDITVDLMSDKVYMLSSNPSLDWNSSRLPKRHVEDGKGDYFAGNFFAQMEKDRIGTIQQNFFREYNTKLLGVEKYAVIGFPVFNRGNSSTILFGNGAYAMFSYSASTQLYFITSLFNGKSKAADKDLKSDVARKIEKIITPYTIIPTGDGEYRLVDAKKNPAKLTYLFMFP